MLRDMNRIILLTLIAAVAPSFGQAQPAEYKTYEKPAVRSTLFEIHADSRAISFQTSVDGQAVVTNTPRSSVDVKSHRVEVNGAVLFDNDGYRIDDQLIPYNRITDLRVEGDNDQTTITVYTRGDSDRESGRIRRGNVIEPFGQVVIDKGDFVRGAVFSVGGNIEVYGEVNHDVVSLFGDIYVGPDAVVRGDVVTLTGRADVARDASVYGNVISGAEGNKGRRHRFHRRENELTMIGDMRYNRVDGLSLSSGVRYDDTDSLLPRLWGEAGYAFTSERWRYELGAEQTVFRALPVMIGGTLYRTLASEDTAIITPDENTMYALLMTEDFMDYYEAEGGRAYVKVRPLKSLTAEGGYRYEDTRWLPAHHNLWSLFGGDKQFGDNFAGVNPADRAAGAAEIDTTTNVALYAHAEWDTRDKEDQFTNSSWVAAGTFEWSHPDLNSDFDYRRWKVDLTRLQRLNRRIMLIVHGTYGSSDGYLPMYKQFYLGGMGTLYGYRHKEYMGTRLWMVNTEYRLTFPRTDLALALNWDMGRIAAGGSFSSDDEVKHSLGASLYIGDGFRMTVAKRLDRSYDDEAKFYVRFVCEI